MTDLQRIKARALLSIGLVKRTHNCRGDDKGQNRQRSPNVIASVGLRFRPEGALAPAVHSAGRQISEARTSLPLGLAILRSRRRLS